MWLTVVFGLAILSLLLFYPVLGLTRNLSETHRSDSLLGQWVGPVTLSYLKDGDRHQPVHTQGVLSITWKIDSVYTMFPKFHATGSVFVQSEGQVYPVSGKSIYRNEDKEMIASVRVDTVERWQSGHFTGELADGVLHVSGDFGELTYEGDLRRGTDAEFAQAVRAR